MRNFLQRAAGPGIVVVLGLGFDAAGFFGSSALAYVAWAVAAIWAVYGAWPYLKRWRPLTLAPEQDALTPATSKRLLPPAARNDLARLKTKITELEQERDSRDTTIEKQRQQLDRFNGDRQRFRALLTEALLEGRRLREKEPGDDDIEEWKSHVRDLLEAALGKGSRVESVVKDDPTFESAVHGSTSEQKQIERSTNRLHDLIEWVKSPQDIPFRSGFDPHKWEDWKSPPPTNEQARIDQLQAALNRVAWERDSLSGRVRELEMMSPEEYRIRQEERRKRIENWRAEIHGHMFARHPWGGSLFAHTEAYSDMRPLLPHDVRQRYEAQFPLFHMSPRKMGKDGDRRVLLDEVSRIEKQWGLV